jgi:hypothetical protein
LAKYLDRFLGHEFRTNQKKIHDALQNVGALGLCCGFQLMPGKIGARISRDQCR